MFSHHFTLRPFPQVLKPFFRLLHRERHVVLFPFFAPQRVNFDSIFSKASFTAFSLRTLSQRRKRRRRTSAPLPRRMRRGKDSRRGRGRSTAPPASCCLPKNEKIIAHLFSKCFVFSYLVSPSPFLVPLPPLVPPPLVPPRRIPLASATDVYGRHRVLALAVDL